MACVVMLKGGHTVHLREDAGEVASDMSQTLEEDRGWSKWTGSDGRDVYLFGGSVVAVLAGSK